MASLWSKRRYDFMIICAKPWHKYIADNLLNFLLDFVHYVCVMICCNSVVYRYSKDDAGSRNAIRHQV